MADVVRALIKVLNGSLSVKRAAQNVRKQNNFTRRLIPTEGKSFQSMLNRQYANSSTSQKLSRKTEMSLTLFLKSNGNRKTVIESICICCALSPLAYAKPISSRVIQNLNSLDEQMQIHATTAR
jgi:hypothetical protein